MPHSFLHYIAKSHITDAFPPHDKESMLAVDRSATVLYYGRNFVQRMPLGPKESLARSRRRMALPKAEGIYGNAALRPRGGVVTAAVCKTSRLLCRVNANSEK